MERTQCLAAHVVGRVLAGRSLDSELTAVWRQQSELSPQQRGAVQDVAYGTLRHLGYVDAAIDRLLSRPLTDLPVRNLLQVTLYQLMHTKAHSYAIVNHAVPAAARLGFPVEYQVLSVSLIRPSPCSDGKVRDMYEYILYLTGSTIATLTTTFQSKFLGIRFSSIISANNCINFHASKMNDTPQVSNTATNPPPY